MKVQVALDRQTGFPCVRPDSAQDFVSLFPVTKLQAEEWIWKKGFASANLTELINRLEVREDWDQFPHDVRLLTRAPISHQQSENLLSIIATNLSLWVTDKETHNTTVEFPTPNSEWGRLIAWLRGRVPAYNDWILTLDEFHRVSTRAIIEGVLSTRYKWDTVIERLLWKVRDTLPRDTYGLPFMKKGLYELIAEPERIRRETPDKLEVRGQRYEKRPQVAGDSPFWATLNSEETSRWRPLRQSTLPVVTVRLWFPEDDVTSQIPNSAYRDFEVEEVGDEELRNTPAPGRESKQVDSPRRNFFAFLKPLAWRKNQGFPSYVKSPGNMKYRCPNCFERVEEGVFATRSHFCCYLDRKAIEKPDGSTGIQETRKHSIDIVPNSVQEISRLYLEVAQRNPAAIHTVGLTGWQEAGKTTCMTSFGGMLDYPDANSVIYQAFPKEWKFSKKPCSLFNFTIKLDPMDRRRATELMWLDGILPVRNSEKERAARLPILFTSAPNGNQHQLLPIIADMAGEALVGDMNRNKNFPHIPWMSDVIFLLPANDIHSTQFSEFVSKFRVARANEKAVDLKRVNLIFVISKIDILKHGAQKDQELLERILPRPYTFPKGHNLAALKKYIDEMYEVHFGIEDWLRNNMGELEAFIDEFASVRYSGISAFGFQPKAERKSAGSKEEDSLPFGPEPVRVADPIFWLMKENGLIEFNERH